MSKLEQLQSLVRKNVNVESEEGLTFYHEIVNLIQGWSYDDLPNLQEIFRPEEINRLLADMMNFYRLSQDKCPKSGFSALKEFFTLKHFIGFVADSGYKDEPDLDRDGRPVTRRTTALHHMARCDPPPINDEMLSDLFAIYHRFDVNYVDEDGLTHLHLACRFGCKDIVKKFLDLGADPNCRVTSTGYSTLHFALQVTPISSRRPMWNLLLKRRANPNLADAEGRSPLHVMCEKFGDDWFLAKYTVKLCDNEYRPLQIYAKDKLGNTPLSLAMRGNHKHVSDLLQESVPNQNLTDAPEESSSAKKRRHEHKHVAESLPKSVTDQNLTDAPEESSSAKKRRHEHKHVAESMVKSVTDQNLTDALEESSSAKKRRHEHKHVAESMVKSVPDQNLTDAPEESSSAKRPRHELVE